MPKAKTISDLQEAVRKAQKAQDELMQEMTMVIIDDLINDKNADTIDTKADMKEWLKKAKAAIAFEKKWRPAVEQHEQSQKMEQQPETNGGNQGQVRTGHPLQAPPNQGNR
ncbi:hypothetical protein [Alkalicoccus saliphilus]|uniref:Uncharacterized protein n=1 Tax=Alkalicoccus saliphilus TaxID=200989 RepID=A0A2T4U3Z5_9BACI|nr:hypothetical protein [Alkalicoccus saliphilus]PTL38120.1 hypothetical protein C6Y45_13070 [Alkalicoccus saliphilus]